MSDRRIEVVLPADVSAHDYTAVAHAVWTVLSEAGLDADTALRSDDEPDDTPDGGR